METQQIDFPVSLRPAGELAPYAHNARTHGEAQIEQLKGLIRLVGFTMPLLVDSQGIIAGHGRQIAVLEMWADGETVMGPGKRFALPEGMVPCIDGEGMTEAERRAYILADNQVALNSDWDRKLLAHELFALKAMDFPMATLGFDTSALVQFMATPRQDRNPDELPPQPDPRTKPGMVWHLGEHRLVCGDCTDAGTVAALVDMPKAVLMVTDPPYGVNYDPRWRENARELGYAHGAIGLAAAKAIHKVDNDDRVNWQEAYALFPGAVAYVWHSMWHTGPIVEHLAACGLEHRSTIIWAKQNFAISRGNYHPQHEPCIYAVRKGKAGNWQGGRKQSTLWNIANTSSMGGSKAPEDKATGHGTQKPVECMRRPIENNSVAGQVVYDPFMGSGTTLIAAELTQRIALGCEVNPAYVDLAVARWQQLTGQQAVLSTGEPFDSL